MANYLVTGAAGFIASTVCSQLLDRGDKVWGVDNMNSYYDVRLKDFRLSRLLSQPFSQGSRPDESAYSRKGKISYRNFTFEAIDIENRHELRRLFEEVPFDAVINLAARAGVRSSMENPHAYLSTNTLGTLNILECMRDFGVKKHILASTSSLYAGCAIPFHEDMPVNTPLSPYAATKKAAELLSYSYFHLYGLQTTVVRYFTVFGPAGRPDMSIFRFVRWIDEGAPVRIFGDGSQTRDFTYVDDIAQGTIAALNVQNYEIINLGGGRQPRSLTQIISVIARELGKTPKITNDSFHSADIKETSADISKAARLMNWSPKIETELGLKRCVEWYLSNSSWIKNLRMT